MGYFELCVFMNPLLLSYFTETVNIREPNVFLLHANFGFRDLIRSLFYKFVWFSGNGFISVNLAMPL